MAKSRGRSLYIQRFQLFTVLLCQDVQVTSTATIQHMKSIFAQHSIPETLISDNGPQILADSFAHFAKEFDVQHQTSSLNFLQSNGEMEQAVKPVKSMLENAKDPYMSLLSYHSTPLTNGYSPAKLLMNCKVCSIITEQYITKILPHLELQQNEQRYRDQQKQRFDTCCKAYCLQLHYNRAIQYGSLKSNKMQQFSQKLHHVHILYKLLQKGLEGIEDI